VTILISKLTSKLLFLWLEIDVLGFAIAGRKILTNAHVVMAMNDHTFVDVKRHGSQIKYKAKVQKISHECDLAILEIDSDEFWKGMNPLELGDIPPLQEVVSVVGNKSYGDISCMFPTIL